MTEPETPDLQSEIFNQFLPLPIRYGIDSAQDQSGNPMVALVIETPAGAMKMAMDREFALNLASAIKKQAERGPMLVSAPPGFVVPKA